VCVCVCVYVYVCMYPQLACELLQDVTYVLCRLDTGSESAVLNVGLQIQQPWKPVGNEDPRPTPELLVRVVARCVCNDTPICTDGEIEAVGGKDHSRVTG
jgi:hypothetical protein